MSAYRCGDFWHIGNLMAQVIKGASSRGHASDRNLRRRAQ